jgi:ATP-binding cassette, subfamily C (CFTR/MRP), member 1
VAFATSAASVVIGFLHEHNLPVLEVVQTLALLPVPFLIRCNHLRTRRSSSIVLLFWPVYAIVNAIWTRTVISAGVSDIDKITLGLRWVLLGMGGVLLALEYLGPETWSELPNEHGRPENPVVIANIYQR